MLIVIIISILLVALFLEISSMNKAKNNTSFDYILDENNFTETLKTVHDNIDENIGKTIKVSGFVFKLPDFKDGYFVCGRNMLIDNDEKVVGFLCTHTGNLDISDSEWIEITGTFVKGYYTTDMPVIEVKTITKIPAPANTFVKTPDFL